eukprot:403331208
MQMFSSESTNLLALSNSTINQQIKQHQNEADKSDELLCQIDLNLQDMQRSSFIDEKLIQTQQKIHKDVKEQELQLGDIQALKSDFLSLHTIDTRISQCKAMSQEIEHFESRIAKVEEYVRLDRFNELVSLVQQLQESLKVVRDLSFFEKQKQRIEKFDKMIMNYMQVKEKELIFDTQYYKQHQEQIGLLITLEQYFNQENQLIERLIDIKLVKEFEYLLNNKWEEINKEEDSSFDDENTKQYQAKFFFKYFRTLIYFMKSIQDFVLQIFQGQQKEKNTLYKATLEKLLQKLLQDYKEKIIMEFVNSLSYDQQLDVYEKVFIQTCQSIKMILNNQNLNSNQHVNISFDSNLHLFFKELYQDLLEKYRKSVDLVVSENFQYILEKDSLESWENNFEKITYVFEKTLINNIEICQCYDLQFLIQTILKTFEKFLMQICFHIGQFCNKRVHLGIPNPMQKRSVITSV